MSQNDFSIANQLTPAFRTDMNSAFVALATNNSGATEPGTTFAYMWWYDTTLDIVKQRNGANSGWINVFTLVGGLLVPSVGIDYDTSPQLGGNLDTNGKQVNLSKGSDVGSLAALVLGADGNYFDITGTNAITSIATRGIGTVVRLHFDGILTLTHHATNLILPGAVNITTAAGDEVILAEYATGDWRCLSYQRAVVGTHFVPEPAAKSKSANYTLLLADEGVVLKTTATMTLTLPTVASAGNGFSFFVWNSNGVMTIDPNGAETIEGDTTKVVTKNHKFRVFCDGSQWRTIGEVPFQKPFLSSAQTITSGGLLTLAHGLGSEPTIIQCYLECTSAEDGYTVGEKLFISPDNGPDGGGSADTGMSSTFDATNVYIRYAANSQTFRQINQTSGQTVELTNANFDLYVRAWA